MKTGHFTQVVWKDSVSLGIGKATVPKGNKLCTYIVARYRPPGNYMGKFQTNVIQGRFNKEICGRLDDMVKDLSNAPGASMPQSGPPAADSSSAQDNFKAPDTQGTSLIHTILPQCTTNLTKKRQSQKLSNKKFATKSRFDTPKKQLTETTENV